jgi:hypothetical protein
MKTPKLMILSTYVLGRIECVLQIRSGRNFAVQVLFAWGVVEFSTGRLLNPGHLWITKKARYPMKSDGVGRRWFH